MLTVAYKNKLIEAEHWEQLSADELVELFRRVNAPWFSTEGRVELTRWLYENQCSNRFVVNRIRAGKERFYGPGDGFRDMTAGEFLFAETYYFSYLNTNNQELLNKLVASLFRERGSKMFTRNKNRVEFDETLINARAKLVENVVFESRQAVLFLYGAVRKDMTKAYPHLFPEKKQKSLDNKQKAHMLRQAQHDKTRKLPVPKWDEWMWKLSAGNTDEDFDKVSRMLVRNFLKRIDSLIYEADKKRK